MIKLKRAYEAASDLDGKRILVDRLWPRGISKSRAQLDRWEKELAPTTELRKWFSHDPAKWAEFERRYRSELGGQKDKLKGIAQEAKTGAVTLVYGAKDEQHNEAVVLKAILDKLD